MDCRHCSASLTTKVLDLSQAPPSNAYLRMDQLSAPETYYPLRLYFCEHCGLVQTEDFRKAEELFDEDYVYFSSTSRSWLKHAEQFSLDAMSRFNLSPNSFVVEIASNDGYLLQNFVAAEIPCVGFEPTASTAKVSQEKGIETRVEFFSEATANQLRDARGGADLIVGNNVFAHVPDINDFTRGMKQLLARDGVISLEFPHLLELVQHGQFDTVYHEHFSYFSLTTVMRIFASAGLRVFDVETLPTHGGSLRVWGCLTEAQHSTTARVECVLDQQRSVGITNAAYFQNLQGQADQAAEYILDFLLSCKQSGETVAAYGAAAKGTTLLNYARLGTRLLPYVVDAAAFKQGRFLPGCHIPVRSPEVLKEEAPDHLLILPWNIKDEIAADLAWMEREHGTQFWTVMPKPARLQSRA